MTVIVQATSSAQLDDVRGLMRDFLTWHRRHHADDIELIERYFGTAEFERELAHLPGSYALPHGRLLLAYCDGVPAGCVALRYLGNSICEMKRMFVPSAFRGIGVGRLLAERIVAQAAGAGYRYMRLDTSYRQEAAISLYQRMGFRRIPPYYPLPHDLRNWLLFFEREL